MDRLIYESLVNEHIDMIYRIAVSHTGQLTDADDIVQQTFLKLLLRDDPFADDEHAKRWLIRVCINECNSLFSSFWHKNMESLDASNVEPTFSMPEYSDLYRQIKQLPAKCRIVVYLFYYEGYSTKEIAVILHIPEPTVRTRLTRARKLLKEKIACQFVLYEEKAK